MSGSNPANQTEANAAAYVQLVLGLLGDRDPMEIMEQQLDWLAAATSGIDDAMLRRPEKPGKWSIIQVVQHLADSELVYGFRLRMVVAHDTPEIQATDQDRWANELKYNDADLGEALDQLRALRDANLRLCRSLTQAQLQRVGIHSERGTESVMRIIQLLGGHDLLHRNQINRIKKAHGLE
jgi:uncharacterized damage-inducible protein DinB